MCLEQKLKVESFRSENQKALINLYYTHSIISNHFKNMLKPYGITPQQFNILRILRGQHPKHLKIKAVKDRLVDQGADLTRILDRMEKKDFIHRKASKSDRRQMNLYITEIGLMKLEEVDEKVAMFEENYTGMNNEDLIRLNDLLAQLRN